MCQCANVSMCQCANVLMCKLFHWHISTLFIGTLLLVHYYWHIIYWHISTLFIGTLLLAHFHIVYSHIIYYRIFNVIIVIAANTMVTIQKRTVIFDSWNTL